MNSTIPDDLRIYLEDLRAHGSEWLKCAPAHAMAAESMRRVEHALLHWDEHASLEAPVAVPRRLRKFPEDLSVERLRELLYLAQGEEGESLAIADTLELLSSSTDDANLAAWAAVTSRRYRVAGYIAFGESVELELTLAKMERPSGGRLRQSIS